MERGGACVTDVSSTVRLRVCKSATRGEPRLLVGQRDIHPPLEPPPHGRV